MTASNQSPRWNDRLIIGYLKDKLEQVDECEKFAFKPAPRQTAPIGPSCVLNPAKERKRDAFKPDPPQIDANIGPSHLLLDPSKAQKAYKTLCNPKEASSHQVYNILRSLPGYTIGDPLRKQDKVLCYCKAATEYAMNKLRQGDCSFIMRSDGSFTYALYEGPVKGDPTTLSFRVDDQGQGHFKRVPMSKFYKLVKVPVLLGRQAPLVTNQRRRSNRRASLPSNVRSSIIISRSRSPNSSMPSLLSSLPPDMHHQGDIPKDD
mmetsp:Transcript_13397/g.29096  ORF Transcript_13397/g.29096 Transcript_13397/m.29096 type:complete len:262 (+) Transcript_13397:107-892(+)|eukprot:CAMPEP_0172321538 /NCGR_PEP_ID=MMETSP1058-20130122/43656_1 /TAXON_ID=83371 /ORGANISM="Detonula confervacea, Strain CCMP 353" /LENGTH=261 /DNA_ID=CAMNT_0013037067 /DNA_START=107 /DNA_END=892 /DNA_ORIENTATION=+